MKLQFEIREVAAIPVAFAQADTAIEQMGPTIGRLLGAVGAAISAQDVKMAGPPFCRCTSWRDTEASVDIGCPIEGTFEGVDGVQKGMLGGEGLYAFCSNFGPYHNLRSVYEEAAQWIGKNGYKWEGEPWETYITDPSLEPDSNRWQTDIYIPVVQGI